LKSVSTIEKTINKKKGFIYLKFYKPNSKKISSKVIYLKTIPKWNWTVSIGFYEDDLIDIIKDNENIISQKYNETLKNVLIISSLLTLLLMFLSFYISRIIEKKFNKYKKDIAHHINKNQKQHELLAQKTKLAAMGEMIENIAHQWRQPLSVITTASTGMKLHKDLNILDDVFFEESIISINSSANHLSDTIEDFRNFFKPNKEKTHFTLNDSVNKMTKLLSSHFKDEKIEIILNIEDISICNFERELLQVLLNIMSNARDALKESKSKKYVFININKKNNQINIEIKDNAGGIKEDILKRVFEPYFTTKHQSQGTGIGLYMSQEIISRHMNGTIEVDNITFEYKQISYTGAKFTITIPA
jgi:signal transduction histidine kinase